MSCDQQPLPGGPPHLPLREAFGVNVHLKKFDPPLLERAHEAIARLGVGRVRLIIDWYKPDEIDLLEPFVRRLKESDVRVLGNLENLVPATLTSVLFPNRDFKAPLDHLDGFLSWAETAVRRFAPYVDDWEILNETNTARFWVRKPSAREFLQLVEPTARLIRSLAPKSQIMLGSIAGNDVTWLAPFIHRFYLKELIALGVMQHVDLVGFHPYTPACYLPLKGEAATARGPERLTEDFFKAYPDLAGKAWITEIGISRRLVRLSKAQIGRVYARWISNFAARGVPVYIWCLQDFDDPYYGRFNPEPAFGLAHADMRLNETGRTLIDELGRQ